MIAVLSLSTVKLVLPLPPLRSRTVTCVKATLCADKTAPQLSLVREFRSSPVAVCGSHWWRLCRIASSSSPGSRPAWYLFCHVHACSELPHPPPWRWPAPRWREIFRSDSVKETWSPLSWCGAASTLGTCHGEVVFSHTGKPGVWCRCPAGSGIHMASWVGPDRPLCLDRPRRSCVAAWRPWLSRVSPC